MTTKSGGRTPAANTKPPPSFSLSQVIFATIGVFGATGLFGGGIWKVVDTLINQGYVDYGMYVAVGGAIIGIAIISVIVWMLSNTFRLHATSSPCMPIKCSRPYLKIPFRSSAKKKIVEQIKAIQCRAHSHLYSAHNRGMFDTRHVRVNLFVPNFDKCVEGGMARLMIPNGLHSHMYHTPELNLELGINEGCTGKAYTTGKTCTWVEGEGKFNLTSEHNSEVHPSLKWIVSQPIVNANDQVMAVLNIDGIIHEFTGEDLALMIAAISPEIIALQERIKKEPNVMLTICEKGGIK